MNEWWYYYDISHSSTSVHETDVTNYHSRKLEQVEQYGILSQNHTPPIPSLWFQVSNGAWYKIHIPQFSGWLI